MGVVRRHLGFKEEVVSEEVPGSKSKLRLNYKEEPVVITMPVDVEAYQRFEDVAKIDKLHCKPPGRPSVRVSEKDHKSLFSIPPLPTSVRERLKDSGYWATDSPKQSGPKLLSVERDFHEGVCRFGMSLSSHLLLLVDVISQAFNQSELDEDQYTDEEIAASINLVGPLVRMVYDQFSRGAVRAVRDKRSAILLEMRWPSSDVRDRFLELPFAGIDLFGGGFDDLYDKEVKSSKQRLDMVFPSTRPKSANSSSRLGVGSGAGRAPQRGGRGGTRGSRRGFARRGGSRPSSSYSSNSSSYASTSGGSQSRGSGRFGSSSRGSSTRGTRGRKQDRPRRGAFYGKP